jgi:hypothetical protein
MALRHDRRAPSPAELALVDGLLTMLTRRMAGALDLGLVLLMEPPAERFSQFVDEHVAAPMRAAALVLRLAMAECVPEPALTPFQAVVVDTETFVGALGELPGFQSLTDAELESATRRLGLAFDRLRDSFLDIAERLGFEPSIARDFPAGRWESIGQVIRRLPGDLRAERG